MHCIILAFRILRIQKKLKDNLYKIEVGHVHHKINIKVQTAKST